MASQQAIAAVRRFNRFYTRQIGVLRKTYLDSPYSLAEMRVLYEIAQSDHITATDVGRTLELDAGYLSRLLRNFEKRGLISRKTSAKDGRQSHLALTPRGRKLFGPMEQRSQQQAGSMLNALDAAQQDQIVAAMHAIETLLAGGAETKPGKSRYILREPRTGDFGWIVSRHAELYAKEYGWIEPFEGLCAQIVADFVNNFDPRLERCWIAEINGENVGCVMLVKDGQPGVARLRLLLVDPKGRGLGLGTRLVDECVSFARTAGYKKITLWTHSILAAARRVYENAGFTLTSSEPRHTWGKDVVAEFWDLDL
ncbi:MAG TPA: bifunctional helix-turn-helix transcriptional regulator/GNAT family N-acetyltransferase [Pseudolabrys sp.]|nr:bifunctional helix-turn-helix transcriptional regulator/GNAT family N-acetyltransferase [Pseudolabrys sp.]